MEIQGEVCTPSPVFLHNYHVNYSLYFITNIHTWQAIWSVVGLDVCFDLICVTSVCISYITS